MALPPKVIYYSRIGPYLLITFCILWSVCMTGAIYLVRPGTPNVALRFIHMGGLLFLGSLIGWHARRLYDNLPALTFHSHALQIHRRKPVFIQWRDITSWKIRSNKNGHNLKIKTVNGNTSIPLGGLDCSKKNIEELVATYIRQPGPGVVQQ